MIDLQKKKKEKLFAAFIDLKKAFDSVWREGLLHKLLKNGIHGKTYNIIKSMYSKTENRIKFKNGISPKFVSTTGVKQGDNLSPTLFNIYINDIVSFIENYQGDPIIVGDNKINILLYADDIILISKSPNGLQNCLNALSLYCNLWKLEVNTAKSNIIVFNSNGRTYNFHNKNTKICFLSWYRLKI